MGEQKAKVIGGKKNLAGSNRFCLGVELQEGRKRREQKKTGGKEKPLLMRRGESRWKKKGRKKAPISLNIRL